MKIYQVTDKNFRKYGRILRDIDLIEIIDKMQETPLPVKVSYKPSVAELEELYIFQQLQTEVYGELPIQVGYCNGNNYSLNALEYHRSSEINIAVTDMILMLGLEQDITEDFTYDTSLVEIFLIPKGTAVEIYATTLHYAPCNASEGGFRAVVVLPKGTNLPLENTHNAHSEDKLIVAKNKWLIGHSEGGLPKERYIGLIGNNISIKE